MFDLIDKQIRSLADQIDSLPCGVDIVRSIPELTRATELSLTYISFVRQDADRLCPHAEWTEDKARAAAARYTTWHEMATKLLNRWREAKAHGAARVPIDEFMRAYLESKASLDIEPELARYRRDYGPKGRAQRIREILRDDDEEQVA